MKAYLGVKQVMAVAMMLLAAQEALGRDVGYEGTTDEKGDAEGYLVQYPDGYQAWSPKDVFEESYRQTDNMNFGLALEALKKGLKVARHGWNGKGMWIGLHKDNGSYKHQETGIDMQYRDYIAMKGVDNQIVPWAASQTDMLADDWEIVD